MVMGARFCLRFDCEGAGPDLMCARILRRHRGTTMQTRRLRDIRIELTGANDPNTIRSPMCRCPLHLCSLAEFRNPFAC
jgi:hypothetical protein